MIHSVFTSTHDCSILSFLEQCPSAPTLPPNPSNPEGLDTEELPSRSPSPFIVPVPVMPPPTSQFHIAPATPKAIQTRSLDPSITWCLTENGQISEKIEADKVREAAAQRGGVLDWGMMDRRADRGVHKRDNTARGTWIHQEIYSDSLPAEHELTSSCNSIVMPLDPSHPLSRNGRSIVGVSASGCGLRRGQDSTSFDFGVCVSPTSAVSVRFSSSASPCSLFFPRFAGFPPAHWLFQATLRWFSPGPLVPPINNAVDNLLTIRLVVVSFNVAYHYLVTLFLMFHRHHLHSHRLSLSSRSCSIPPCFPGTSCLKLWPPSSFSPSFLAMLRLITTL